MSRFAMLAAALVLPAGGLVAFADIVREQIQRRARTRWQRERDALARVTDSARITKGIIR